MEVLITIVHVVVSLFLVMVVLLQTGKGAEAGAVLGGAGSQTVFGGSGGATVLSKLTVAAAVIFMLTSISLTYLSGAGSTGSVMDAMDQAPVGAEPDPYATPVTGPETATGATTGATMADPPTAAAEGMPGTALPPAELPRNP